METDRSPAWRRYLRFLRSDIEADVDDEMRFHLEMRAREYEARGFAPRAARRAARERFGDVDRVAGWLRAHDRRQERERHVREFLNILRQNLVVGGRLLRKQPTFTAAAALTLALGIGATTAMFSVVYGVLLRPLPFPEPDRVVRLWTVWKPSLGRAAVGAANARDWRAQNHVFEDIALIHTATSFNFTERGEPERLRGARVSASFFPLLRVTPLLGRTFAASENEIGRDNVVVLSHHLWVRAFGANPSIVGQTIHLNGAPTTVIGVMRPDFQYPTREFDLWTPITVPADEYGERTAFSYSAIARLKPGVTIDQARADMHRVSMNLANEYRVNRRIEVGLAPLLDDMIGTVRRPLFILLGAVGVMLLIGCANLTNLLLARGVARRRELAVRAALGASRARLIEQSITELVPLLALGAALGLASATWIVHGLVPLLPADLPRVEAISINLPVLGFTMCVTMVIAVLVAVWPAVAVARSSVSGAATELSRASTLAPRRARLRDLLVIGQIATTMLLLVGAMVLMRSFIALRQVSPGFNADHVLSVHIAVPRPKYPLDDDVNAFFTQALERVHELPSVTAAGLVSRLPLSGNNQTGSVEIDGARAAVRSPNVETRSVSPEYFKVLEIPLLSGRAFLATDGEHAPQVAIVDERFARQIWPGENPIGKRIRESSTAPWNTVVGLVAHIKHRGLDDDSDPQIYWNYEQRSADRMALVIKTKVDPATLTHSVAEAIRSVDREQPIYDAMSLDDVVDRSLGQRRFQMLLLGTFAAIALMLASIGAYGVIAYGVGQRLREFGIRIALGARRRDVVTNVLARGGVLFGVGAVLGIGLATVAVRLLSTLVYSVAPRDLVSFALSTAVLFVVSMAACYIPARRAARVDPSIALRSE